MFVSLLLSTANEAVVLPNLILSIASLPLQLAPAICSYDTHNTLHWFLSCIPLFVSEHTSLLSNHWPATPYLLKVPAGVGLSPEMLSLLYPLHQSLCMTLQYLTTTSLLSAEVQLLSMALVNLLLLSSSPQAVILKSFLWGGCTGLLILCTPVLRWGMVLARVPSWRFRKTGNLAKGARGAPKPSRTFSLYKAISHVILRNPPVWTDESGDDEPPLPSRAQTFPESHGSTGQSAPNEERPHNGKSADSTEQASTFPLLSPNTDTLSDITPPEQIARRQSSAGIGLKRKWSSKRTPSGRRKRSASTSNQYFLSLTHKQAAIRKWLYAIYVYVCIIEIALLVIRAYVQQYALDGNEPVGWVIGYVLGDLHWLRMEVTTSSLSRWICLPAQASSTQSTCNLGVVPHLRFSTLGPSNTRLVLAAYWVLILVTGLAIVFRLSARYNVDTIRKVFHFMMVAMLMPSTFVDPAFVSLALSIVLAVFLLLDLFRASQLPPLSKPLAKFLTPYVDGRDLRGPVVISHIFLLIGCAIPFWLSMATIPRTGTGCTSGWELPTRDISMVSGVVCVGMGDAAASLVGRRFGRRKWLWSGGKSIEGSVAFAAAVTIALGVAKAWLKFGGWAGDNGDTWAMTAGKAVLAAAGASLTEAVLTGGNDNVICPIVLFLLCKGLDI